jgi:6-pyruvoyltetrahydropterin/6-carboxytetrahydropterin synthase
MSDEPVKVWTQATRRIEWDSAHRVTQHGGKCRNLHGHRYAAEVTIRGQVPEDGMVLDFGIIKRELGGWIDDNWDHGALLSHRDAELHDLCDKSGWKVWIMAGEPTAETIAEELFIQASLMTEGKGLIVEKVRVYETPNCYAEVVRHA